MVIVFAIFWGISGTFAPVFLLFEEKGPESGLVSMLETVIGGCHFLIFLHFPEVKRHFSKSGKKPIDVLQIFLFK